MEEKEIKNWILGSQYDLETARSIFDSGKYVYTVFMCHLALERILKAKVVEKTGKTAPKTHDLDYLVRLSGLSPDQSTLDFISEISNISIVTRYPADFLDFKKIFPKKKTQMILTKSLEAHKWIRKSIVL